MLPLGQLSHEGPKVKSVHVRGWEGATVHVKGV